MKNFFHDISDILLALLIVLIASGIILWRMQVIMAYPDKVAAEANKNNKKIVVVEEKQEQKAAEEKNDK